MALNDGASSVGVLYGTDRAFVDLEADTVLEDKSWLAAGSDTVALFVSDEVSAAFGLDAFSVGPDLVAFSALNLKAFVILESIAWSAAGSDALASGLVELVAFLFIAAESDASAFLIVFEAFFAV